jgi:hypothetical protein
MSRDLNQKPLNWAAIVQLRDMPYLRDFPEAEHLFDGDYKLSDSAYLRAALEWRDFDFTEQDVFVSSFLWASNYASFLYVRRRSREAPNEGKPNLPIPLRATPDCINYGDLKRRAKRMKLRHSELHLHEPSFIGTCFSFPRFTYFFSSPRPEPEDFPLACEFHCRSEERVARYWTPC